LFKYRIALAESSSNLFLVAEILRVGYSVCACYYTNGFELSSNGNNKYLSSSFYRLSNCLFVSDILKEMGGTEVEKVNEVEESREIEELVRIEGTEKIGEIEEREV
ncbi:28399_t:CDS:2, partial [Racocetra persica]